MQNDPICRASLHLDLVALGLVAVFALWGAFAGAASQVVHLVGLILGWATGRFLGFHLGPRLGAEIGLPGFVGFALLAAVLGFAVFVVVALVGKKLLAEWRGGEGPGPADRGFGVILGAAKAGLIVYLVASVLVFFEAPARRLGYRLDLRRSETATLARRYNLLAHAGLPLDKVRRALERVGEPGAEDDPAIRRLAADPRVRRLAGDAGVQAALQRGDYVGVLQNPELMALIGNPETMAQLEAALEAP